MVCEICVCVIQHTERQLVVAGVTEYLCWSAAGETERAGPPWKLGRGIVWEAPWLQKVNKVKLKAGLSRLVVSSIDTWCAPLSPHLWWQPPWCRPLWLLFSRRGRRRTRRVSHPLHRPSEQVFYFHFQITSRSNNNPIAWKILLFFQPQYMCTVSECVSEEVTLALLCLPSF